MLLVGLGLAFLAYHPSKTIRRIDPARMAYHFGGLYTFLRNKWYFDEVYDALFVRPTLAIARAIAAVRPPGHRRHRRRRGPA